MRDTLIVIGLAIVVIVVGVLIYLYVPVQHAPAPTDQTAAPAATTQGVAVAVLKQGTTAPSSFMRTNYRIKDADQLGQLWSMLYGPNAPAPPAVDFSSQEVVAVFDGSHSTGGYSISVAGVTDSDGVRTISVTHTAPGTDCSVTESVTSPYEIVAVPKTVFAFKHEDASATSDCS